MPEDRQRDDRLWRAPLGPDEHERKDDQTYEQGNGWLCGEASEQLRAVGPDDEAGDECGDHRAAKIVDLRLAARRLVWQHLDQQHERNPAERQVREEDRTPPPIFRHHAAQDRADGSGQEQDQAREALVPGSLAWLKEVTGDGEDRDNDAPCPESLEKARGDQAVHRRSNAAGKRAEQENHHCREEHRLAAKQVAQLAGNRHHRAVGDQVRRRNPAVLLNAAELLHDSWQGRRDDLAVEHRKKCAAHEDGEDGPLGRGGKFLGHGLRRSCLKSEKV